MLFIDTLLLSPIYGAVWAARQVHNAIQQERAAEPARITAELSELYMMLETHRITEAEFDAREKVLLDQLDHLQEGESLRDEEAKSVSQQVSAPCIRRLSSKMGARTEPRKEGRAPTVHPASHTRFEVGQKKGAGKIAGQHDVMLAAAAVVMVLVLMGWPGALAEGSSNLADRLSEQRWVALGMIETGCRSPQTCLADRLVGQSGEVSRYQILPAVWRQHHRPQAGRSLPAQSSYGNPVVAQGVAERIMDSRTATFVRATGRTPSDFEWYVLWNAPGAFARVGYAAHRLRPVVKERAQRFTDLTARPVKEPLPWVRGLPHVLFHGASEERPMSTSEP